MSKHFAIPSRARRSASPAGLVCCSVLLLIVSCAAVQGNSRQSTALPGLNPSFSPLAPENRSALLARMTAAFDREHGKLVQKSPARNFASHFAVYYLRQELQALIDVWRATGQEKYIRQAGQLAIKAISDAKANRRPHLRYNKSRGVRPCFLNKSVEKQTGGHNQVVDFQGAAGLMMVAVALKDIDPTTSRRIAEFIEAEIVEKWLFYDPARTRSDFSGPQSGMRMLSTINSPRGMRAHVASVCLSLHQLGRRKYPYLPWAQLIIGLYLSPREFLGQSSPYARELGRYDPRDWGLFAKPETSGVIWYSLTSQKLGTLAMRDTSHANRTAWLATEAYENKMIDHRVVRALANTLRNQIWDRSKGPFYFKNMIDGTDTTVQRLGPGRKGNIWFGWHRLAAYDPVLRDLFISLAYDLSNGGPNLPAGAQNKSMANAPMCFYAWAARLLSPEGEVRMFP